MVTTSLPNLQISSDLLFMSSPSGQPLVLNGFPVNAPAPWCATCGQPVNLATGAMWHRIVDFSVAGRTAATSILFERTYLAQPVFSVGGDFGPNWIHNWETRIYSVSANFNSNLLWIDEHGGAYAFAHQSDGSFANPAGFFGSLTEHSDHYELRKPHGIVLSFSKTIPGV
ncbi:MAG: DUF6531 domain-containing protein, partial [Bdellovibrionota bacterium]